MRRDNGIDYSKFTYYSSILPEIYYAYQNKKYELNWYTPYSHEKNWSDSLLRKTLDYFIELAITVPHGSVYSGLKTDSECFEYVIKPKSDGLNFYPVSSVRNPAKNLSPDQIIYTLPKGKALRAKMLHPTREKYNEYVAVSDEFSNGAAQFSGAEAEITMDEIKISRTRFLNGFADQKRK